MKKFQACVLMMVCLVLLASNAAKADPKEITSGVCETLKFDDIPVGDFNSAAQMPESTMRITQIYNNKLEKGSDAYCLIPGGYASWDSDACIGQKIYYGHDGIDIHQSGATEGQSSVFSAQDGEVVVSHKVGTKNGWGETIIIATRTNKFSDEILTYHYHHLYATGVSGKNYTTTRLFNACDQVVRGEEIAKEGMSGTSAVHLHLSIRRWRNLKELQAALKNNGQTIYGVGYSFGNDSKLAKHLDPYGILYNGFSDFTANPDPPPYSWAQSACFSMRQEGIEFGLWNGEFGAVEAVKRREGVRWIKTSIEQPDMTPSNPTFSDVPAADPDAPSIEALTKYPALLSVVNPYATCEKGAKKFCPDSHLKRSEALKMIVLGFYADKFLQVYDSDVWKNSYAAAMNFLSLFQDVNPLSWFAPYVYFGRVAGVVADQQNFRPDDDITRAELAKWIRLGIEFHKNLKVSACNSIICSSGSYCDGNDGTCKPVSSCVPSETVTCEVGGGYQPAPAGTGGSGGSGGSSGSGGAGGTTGTGGTAGAGSSGAGGSCTGCAPGTTEQKSCNGSGKQSRLCLADCTWGGWGMCALNCPPGFINCNWSCVDKLNDNGNCGGCGITCTGGTSCDGGFCKPGGSGGGAGSSGSNCQDTYAAGSGTSCYGNPQGAGNPTLCLEVNHSTGSSFEYRVCKQGGSFSNSFSYQLKDDNYGTFFTAFSEASGIGCTPWKSFSVSYITGDGTVNGAGVEAEVISPQGCSQSSCKYKTGTITISKTCQ